MTISVIADGLADFARYVEAAPEAANRAAVIALNDTVQRKGLPLGREKLLEQVAFPKGYLNDDTRFGVTQYAKAGDLQAAITGRQEPTSLARFMPGQPQPPARGPFVVRINPGRSQTINRAFLVRLKSGNVGVALRLREGERVENRYSGRVSWLVPNKVALLYGPSVDQVFRQVADEISPAVLDYLDEQFTRQYVRLVR